MDLFRYIKDVLLGLQKELIRYRSIAAIIFAIIFLAVIFVAINWRKVYVSEAAIVKDVTNVIEPLLGGTAEVADVNKSDSVQELLLSRRLLDRVLVRVNPNLASLSPDKIERELFIFRSRLRVVPDRVNTDITYITFSSPNPDEAYQSLKAVVDLFIEERMEKKQKVAQEAATFIGDQVIKYKERLEMADQKLKEFKSRNLDASEDVVKDRIASLTNEIQGLRITIQETEEKIRTTHDQLDSETKNVSQRARLKNLVERRASLISQLDQLRLTYQDSYPDIVTLKSQIAEVDGLIEKNRGGLVLAPATGNSGQSNEIPLYEALRKQISTAEVDLKTQRRRISSLEELLVDEYKTAKRVQTNQAELSDLTRDYDVTKKVYEEMLARKENANITQALNDQGQGESYRMLEPPTYPLKPEGIPALAIFLGAPLAALLVPVALALAYVVLDPRIKSPALLMTRLPEGIPFLGAVPHRGTALAARLLRKDMILLILLAMILLVLYIYTFLAFKNVLLS